MSAKTVLVTFDVDGTLIHSVGADANKFHKDAFSHAFKEVYGIDTNIDVIHHHGCTDRQVARRTLLHNGLTEAAINEKLGDCMDSMIRYAAAHHQNAKTGIEVLPGVAELLEELSKRPEKVTVALVTGNLQPIGWIKMEALGLRNFFTPPGFGGFGSDHEERGELVLIASKRAAELGRPHSAHWHVGDTPADISAAEYGGARPLGVCTGVYKEADLRAASKDPAGAAILPDLRDTQAVLRLLLGEDK